MGFFDLFKGEQPPLVDQAFDNVQVMLETGHRMFAASSAHLLDNEILEVDLHDLDKEINKRERGLRRALLEHLNVNPTQELIFSLKLLSIVHEAERIGDLAKSMEKTAALAKKPRMGAVAREQREIRDVILSMFDRAQEGFVDGDLSAARELMRTHEDMKDTVTEHLQRLADGEDITPNEALVYALSARLMSRVSSHLSNIASTVVSPFDHIRRAPTWKEGQPTGLG